MTNRISAQLVGVEETLLIPLWARALETRRRDGLFRDELALALVERFDYDFAKLRLDAAQQASIAIRTEILDEGTRAFLARHPDGLVINVAAGLDTRFHRLDNGALAWFDLDLPAVVALREAHLPACERVQPVAGSALEDGWCDQVVRRPGQAVLILVEGFAMYLAPEELRALVVRLADRFPGAQVLLECVSPFMAEKSAAALQARGMPIFRNGLEHGRDLEAWDPRLRYRQQWFNLDRHPRRWGLKALARWIPVLRNHAKIVQLELAP